MKIGVNTSVNSDSYDVAALAKRAEELGFESFFLPEHTIMPVNVNTRYHGSDDGSIPDYMTYMADPLVALSRASAVTSEIKLGTGVLLVPEHNPILLAKEIATLDHFSGGRFLFGIGSGWLREETEIMGGDFDHRWTQTKDAILAMKELWTKEEAEYNGKYYSFPPVRCNPKPASKPHPPVILGGFAKNVFKRVVDYGDGWMPTRVTPDDIRRGRATIDELAEAAGRDPESIEITVFGLTADEPERIKEFEDTGAVRAIVRLGENRGEESIRELERMAAAVL